MKDKKIALSLILTAFVCFPAAVMSASGGPPTNITFENIIKLIKGLIYTVGIAMVVIMLLISGIMFITSSGDPEKIKKARSALLYAVVGAVVLVVAASIFEIIERWL
ncbi:MAG: hypothetical protein HYT36_03435 [Candidatus Staskawiczbacteria bacterium]|nr:hypothetical protein [Candidatus Staskawiczbacteria bacterium]